MKSKSDPLASPFDAPASKSRGSTFLGVILGVFVGLGLALAVAMYVMKVPTPFNSKNATRTSAQDEQEAKKNKDWDPNASLAGKPAPKADAPFETEGDAPAVSTPAAATSAPTAPTAPNASIAPVNKSAEKAQALLDGAPAALPQTTTAAAPSASVPPPPAPAPAATSGASGAGAEFYVQVGAFRSLEEANALRAKLLLANFEGRIVERDQSGSKVYRVRVGPQSTQATSEKAKAALGAAGFEGIVVRTPIH